MKLEETLQEIGLTNGEIQIYTALLDLGIGTAGQITKQADVASSKVYEVLERLMNKGLASFVIQKNTKHYSATPPERLIDFLEQKKQKLSQGQQAIKELLPELKRRREERKQTEAVIYRGREGPLIALNEILEEMKKGHESVGFGTNEDDYAKLYPAQLNDFIEESKNKKLKTRLLFAEGYQPPNKTAQVRHLPEEYFSPVRTMVAGNKVFIVDFTNPVTTIVVNKKEIAQSYANHFNTLWKIADRRIKLLEGKQGIKKIFRDVLEVGKDYFYIGSAMRFETDMPKEIKKFIDQVDKKGICETAIVSEDQKNLTKAKKHKYRYLPKELVALSSMMIYGNKVALFVFEDPQIQILIDNKAIAESYKKQFLLLWKQAKT